MTNTPGSSSIVGAATSNGNGNSGGVEPDIIYTNVDENIWFKKDTETESRETIHDIEADIPKGMDDNQFFDYTDTND